jgi:hypothetical protein
MVHAVPQLINLLGNNRDMPRDDEKPPHAGSARSLAALRYVMQAVPHIIRPSPASAQPAPSSGLARFLGPILGSLLGGLVSRAQPDHPSWAGGTCHRGA